MSRALAFMMFLLFLAGLALAMLRGMKDVPQAERGRYSVIAGEWASEADSRIGDQPVFVRFQSDGKISGFAGCNRFFGAFSATNNTLKIERLGATRKICPEPAMIGEKAFLGSIATATAYRIDGRTLMLDADDGNSLMLILRVEELSK